MACPFQSSLAEAQAKYDDFFDCPKIPDKAVKVLFLQMMADKVHFHPKRGIIFPPEAQEECRLALIAAEKTVATQRT